MTRRRFYAPPEAFSPDRKSARLSLEETRHLRDVLHLRPGDEVHVFDGLGNEFRCAIATMDHKSATLNVIQQDEPASPESPLSLTLAVALLKGEKFDLVIQKATELGVARVIPVVSLRADMKLRSGADAERKVTRWQRIALEATKQCGRARLLGVDAAVGFTDLIKSSEDGDVLRLMFAEREGSPLANALSEIRNPVSQAIALVGPEGGWDDDEIQQARDAGWRIVTLAGRTLRAETAAIAIAAILQHRFGDLS